MIPNLETTLSDNKPGTEPGNTNKNPFRMLANKIADTRNKNKTNDIVINNQNTNIPNNLPTAIIGDKGSGKTTLINAIIESTHTNQVFDHIYYLYSSLTLDLELPNYVTKIDINSADSFLANLFEIKAIYNSYLKLFNKLRKSGLLDQIDSDDLGSDNDHKVLKSVLDLCDNEVMKYNQDIINSGLQDDQKIDKILTTGEKIVTKFSKSFYIGSVRIEGLKQDERDAIIIDDIAIAAKILFRKIKDNPIYEYLTLTRHIRIFVLFAGQQIEQIPKTIRREVCCWLVSKNTNLELLNGVLSKQTLGRIESKQLQLQKYEFVVYNCDSGYLGII